MSTQSVRLSPRLAQQSCRVARRVPLNPRTIQRRASHQRAEPAHNGLTPNQILVRVALALGFGAAALHGSRRCFLGELHADAPPAPAEIQIEKKRKTAGLSKEQNRDTISSQHLQVKRSWENPGVYAWGSNTGRVVAPDSDETVIKLPRRIPYFDGTLLRDLKLDRHSGAAVTEKGDLVQWGIGFSADVREPTPTLTGKDLVSITISRDRIIALSSGGKVYSLPISKDYQERGPKPQKNTWIPFWSSRSNVSYRSITPENLSYGERVTAISSGLEHVLILTSSGRVFTAASCSEEFPSRGEMGIPGLNWSTKPEGPYDQPHEITTLRGFDIAAVASGDYHSLVLDKEGRMFSFGDNTSGQLGFDPNAESPYIDAPSLVPVSKLYAGTGLAPHVTSIFAGGLNSFFTVDARRVQQPGESAVSTTQLGRVTADTWACGQGILGTLGNGRWTHNQGTPTKLKSLSGLFEWDEKAHTVIPIRLRTISVGSTHASAIMNNVTHVKAGESKATNSRNDTNWGADVVWWGGNEFHQLGMGKRNNVSTPGYIAPLDMLAERERAKRKEEHRFQITPTHKVDLGGRKVSIEQRVECGRMCSAVYSGV